MKQYVNKDFLEIPFPTQKNIYMYLLELDQYMKSYKVVMYMVYRHLIFN